jgi:protein-disulfide isomerase
MGETYQYRRHAMKKISAKFAIVPVAAAAFMFASPVIAAPEVNWAQTITETPMGGYSTGNPAAKNLVVEYASYTCLHCATFEAVEAPKLKSSYVSSGKVRFEIRTLVRDPIDLTLAMLSRCGGKARFFGNHKFLMANQKAILNKAGRISAASQAKLKNKDLNGFMVGAYTDMGLAAIIAPRGITNAQARMCLSDKIALQKILNIGEDIDKKYNYPIKGTPAFIVNGKYADIAPNIAAISALFTK